MAIEKVVSLCVSNPLLHGFVIDIVSDCLVAVTWINFDSVGSLEHVNLIHGIRDILRSHGSLAISFNPRTSNSYADMLAKKGSNMEGDILQWGSI